MSCPKKSRALVIVNYDFYRSTSQNLSPRPGAVKEAKRLCKTLSDCNYEVRLCYDLTAKEIEDAYEKECDADHGDYFVSILSSHGEEGIILDCEGQPVQLMQIFQALSPQRCHKLAGKPKIFFIQACRGEGIDPGVWVETDSAELQTDSFSHYLSIPENTAVMFASCPGYAAFINQWESMFLGALQELLKGEERHLELARLMTRISWKVAVHCQARGQHSGGKEMPCFVTTMLKEVYPFSQRRPTLNHYPPVLPADTIPPMGSQSLICGVTATYRNPNGWQASMAAEANLKPAEPKVSPSPDLAGNLVGRPGWRRRWGPGLTMVAQPCTVDTACRILF